MRQQNFVGIVLKKCEIVVKILLFEFQDQFLVFQKNPKPKQLFSTLKQTQSKKKKNVTIFSFNFADSSFF